ncbi:hypothetical protein Dimus_010815 [Dionaea muscipula]
MMWSFDSARNREIRVRDLVERTMKDERDSIKHSLVLDFSSSTEEVILADDLRPLGSSSADDLADIDGALMMGEASDGELEEGVSSVQGLGLASVNLADASEQLPLTMASAMSAAADVYGGPVMEDDLGGGSLGCGGSGSVDEALGGGSTAAGGVLCPAFDQLMSSSSQVLLLTEHAVSGSGDFVSLDGCIDCPSVGECHLLPDSVRSGECNVVSAAAIPMRAVAEFSGKDGMVREEGSRCFIHDGGLVSEEDMVTPVARAAVRPQPTDGLRQPPASSVKPAVVVRSGLGVLSADGLPGSGVATPRGLSEAEVHDKGFSGRGLAPPASPRRLNARVGCTLTDPHRHRSFVDDCRCHLQAVHPRLIWSIDSARNHQIRVRYLVEKTMKDERDSIKHSLVLNFSSSTEEVILADDLWPQGSSSADALADIDGALMMREAADGELEEGVTVSSTPLSLSRASIGPVDGALVNVAAVGVSTEQPCHVVDGR